MIGDVVRIGPNELVFVEPKSFLGKIVTFRPYLLTLVSKLPTYMVP